MLSVSVYRPGEVELADVRNIEVQTFTVPANVLQSYGDTVRGAGETVGQKLADELRRTKRFIVVGQFDVARFREVQEARKKGLVDAETADERSKPKAADAIVRGHVVAYKCEEVSASKKANNVAVEVAADPSTSALRAVGLMKEEQIPNLEGTVAVAFEVLDARTNEIKTSGEASHAGRRVLDRSISAAVQQEKLLNDLLNQCVQEIVWKLVRHREQVQLVFVRGGSSVNRGIALAAHDNWKEAREMWEEAVQKNKHDHAACYNLGLAHLREMDYEGAEKQFAQAAKLKADPLYDKALRDSREARQKVQLSEIELENGCEKVNRGIAFAHDNDWDSARRVWEEAIKDNANDHAAWYDLGMASRVAGERDKARACFEKANRLAPRLVYQKQLQLMGPGTAVAATEQEQGEVQPVSATVAKP
jgi:tetratricopeptide (TPR) repeat protein